MHRYRLFPSSRQKCAVLSAAVKGERREVETTVPSSPMRSRRSPTVYTNLAVEEESAADAASGEVCESLRDCRCSCKFKI